MAPAGQAARPAAAAPCCTGTTGGRTPGPGRAAPGSRPRAASAARAAPPSPGRCRYRPARRPCRQSRVAVSAAGRRRAGTAADSSPTRGGRRAPAGPRSPADYSRRTPSVGRWPPCRPAETAPPPVDTDTAARWNHPHRSTPARKDADFDLWQPSTIHSSSVYTSPHFCTH